MAVLTAVYQMVLLVRLAQYYSWLDQLGFAYKDAYPNNIGFALDQLFDKMQVELLQSQDLIQDWLIHWLFPIVLAQEVHMYVLVLVLFVCITNSWQQ